MTFGEGLRAARLGAGLTLEAAGELVGVCHQTWSHYEVGRDLPSRETYDLMREWLSGVPELTDFHAEVKPGHDCNSGGKAGNWAGTSAAECPAKSARASARVRVDPDTGAKLPGKRLHKWWSSATGLVRVCELCPAVQRRAVPR